MNHPCPPNLDNPSAGKGDGDAGAAPGGAGATRHSNLESAPRLEPAVARTEPMEPHQAQEALVEIQALLRRARRVAAVVHNQVMDKHELVENLVYRQNTAKLGARLEELHPADIAYILEALPRGDRIAVWDLIKSAERDGEILVEVSDAVRETLIENMDTAALVAAAETLDTDELADIADDLPAEVIREVREGLTQEEREQLRSAMSYPDDAVGALMDFEMVTVREDVTTVGHRVFAAGGHDRNVAFVLAGFDREVVSDGNDDARVGPQRRVDHRLHHIVATVGVAAIEPYRCWLRVAK